ncbi:MAG TPA: GrpB family protein [Thermoanaerobaculia bacterium]|nr:GrpB family protein [Thermoanaerobaculia bacterium]
MTRTEADQKMGELVRAARLIRELRDSGCHDPRETIAQKIRRLQDVRSPELPPRVRDLRSQAPDWPVRFATEAGRVRAAMGGAVVRIEHFGSTAIFSPALSSKNVIDFLVALAEPAKDRSAAVAESALRELGYEPYGNGPCDPETDWWWKIENGEVAYVAHVCGQSNPWIETAVNFRDYMRAHPAECSRYEEVKQRLAAEPGRSLFEYSIGKLRLFYDISGKANAWKAALTEEQPESFLET